MCQDGIRLADVEGALKGRREHFRFTPKLEKVFKETTRDYRARAMRVNILPSILIYNAFLAADILLVPDTIWLAVAFHLGIVTPLMLAGGVTAVHRLGLIIHEALAAGIPLIMATMILIIYALNHSEGADQYQYLAIMVLVYMNVNQRPAFEAAAGASALLAGLYLTVLFMGPSPASVKLMGAAWMTAATYLTLMANWRMECDARYAFLKRLEDQLRRGDAEAKASKDALTGLFNRRYLDDVAARLWSEPNAASSGTCAAVIMIDVDFFKDFNDRYGHPAGDLCLQRVADAIAGQLRDGEDLAVRYGGEEFLVLMPRTDMADALLSAERIRRAVEDRAIPHSASTRSAIVTASLGVMAGPISVHSPSELINGADAALYAAKRNGRNQVWPPFLAVGASQGGSSMMTM